MNMREDDPASPLVDMALLQESFQLVTIQGLIKHPEKELNHLPYALYPSRFPNDLFRRAESISDELGRLYCALASDKPLLMEVLTDVQGDDFVESLIEILKLPEGNPVSLGILRADYLPHSDNGLIQVEVNTISSSFGAASDKVSELHQLLDAKGQSITKVEPMGNLPNLVRGMSEAVNFVNPLGYCLFVVHPEESNVSEQKIIEWHLWKDSKIRSLRLTLLEIASYCQVDERSLELTYKDKPISLVYFRTGYNRDHYCLPNSVEFDPRCWSARALLERSRAIKCPSVGMQLTTFKVFQCYLKNSDFIEKNGCDPNLRSYFSPTLELVNDQNRGNLIDRLRNKEKFVLKPLKEGGAHNFFGDDIFQELKTSQHSNYVIQSQIESPIFDKNQVVVSKWKASTHSCVTEIGIFSIHLFDSLSSKLTIAPAGHIARTKDYLTDEGGIASGFAYLSSLNLF